MVKLKALSEAIIRGDQAIAVDITKTAIDDGVHAGSILEDGLVAGMNIIGARFKAGEIYFFSQQRHIQ